MSQPFVATASSNTRSMPSWSISRLINGVARRNCRSAAVGIGKILNSDRWVERQQIATVVLDLGGQSCRIEIGGSLVREGVAGDFVALAVKLHNLIATYSGPMARPFIDEPTRDIEGRPRIVGIEHWDPDGGRALRGIVERKTDRRAFVSQPKRHGAKMPRQAVVDARL